MSTINTLKKRIKELKDQIADSPNDFEHQKYAKQCAIAIRQLEKLQLERFRK